MYIELGEKIREVEYNCRKAAYAIILNEKNEAAIIKTPRAYFLPGGGLEQGESYEQCVVREVLEETGFEFKVAEFMGCATAYEFSPRVKKFMKGIGYFFTGKLGDKACEKIEADHELVWMKCEEAIEKLVLEHQVWAIEETIRRIAAKNNELGGSLLLQQRVLSSFIFKSWSAKSSTGFSFDNPARGQCGVTALVVNDYFKWKIYKTLTPEGWHFYNFIDGAAFDFTDMQFEDVIDYNHIPSSREEVFKYCTREQYDYLKTEVTKYFNYERMKIHKLG